MGIKNLFSLLLVPIALSSGAKKVCYSPATDTSSKVPMPTSLFVDNLPKTLTWFPAVDKPGVSCVGACADGRFKFAAVSHKVGDSAPCHCADPPSGLSPPNGTEQSFSYHLVSVPKLSDDTQYATDHPTTAVVHLGSGLIRYIINGVPQPMRFLPAQATGTLRFSADKQGAVGCVGSCWKLGYSVAGLDTTNCVCADLENVKLVDQYRPNSEQIPAVDIKMFLKKPEPSKGVNMEITTVPHSHYVRLFFNNVPTGTWFTSSGIPKPPGKWEPIPENTNFPEWKDLPGSEGSDTCVNKCAQKHKSYAALLWVKDGYKCMCGEADVKSPETPLLNYYPTSPGAWQIVNVTIAQKSKPLASVDVSSGNVQMGQISADEIDNGYIKFSLKTKDASTSLPLQSSYVSSTLVNTAQSGMSWLEQSFPAGGDNRVQCVAECYKLQFNAAALTSDNKCYCIDDTKKRLKPSVSPPSTGGKVQVIMLPEPPKQLARPSSSSTTITRSINIDAKVMSGAVFRLIINGVKVPAQFASADSISKANAVSFTADLFASQPGPMSCVTRCFRMNFALVTLVDTKCKCMDSGAISLSSSSSEGAITVYDISSYLPTSKPAAGVSVSMFLVELPESHYMRLIVNNAVSRTWFTAPGVEPVGTWQTVPGALSFGTCVDTCTQKFQPYAALLWDEGHNFKCKCGATSGKFEGLTERYPSTPGAWQVMDISSSVMSKPLPITEVADFTGRKVKFSGTVISNGYIKFTMQQSGEKSDLKSAYLSALSSAMTWMEYTIPAGSEAKVGCVSACFMLHFIAAALTADSKCYCADVSGGQLTLSPSASPPSKRGMVQIVILPQPSTSQTTHSGSLSVVSWTMTTTLFRVIVNGVPLKPQFAQPDEVSKAAASSGVSFPAGSSWLGKPNTGHCVLKCVTLFFPLVTVIGDDCKCMEKGEISLTSSNAEGLVSVYDASASIPKNTGKRTIMHQTVPVTNYVRLMIGDSLAPTKFVAPGSLKGWKKIEKMHDPYNCIAACHGASKYASMTYDPSGYTGQCHCSPHDAEDISFPDKITYPSTGGQEQIFDIKRLSRK